MTTQSAAIERGVVCDLPGDTEVKVHIYIGQVTDVCVCEQNLNALLSSIYMQSELGG